MSSKPTDSGRFAVDLADVNATNISAPTSGLRTTGFPNNYVPPAAEFNYLENVGYRWRQWLFDGDCDFATLAVSGTLGVGGAVTIGGDTTIGAPLTFTAFAFTANSSTDILTKTAHGLQTGDGPVRVTNSGGALPGGLNVGVDYWVILDSADTFKLATALSGAIAGNAVDITTNGTGTQTLSSITATRRPHDLAVTRDLAVADDVNVGGILTASGGVTVGVNKNVTVSGTGKYVHGSRSLHYSAVGASFVFASGLPPTTEVTPFFDTSLSSAGGMILNAGVTTLHGYKSIDGLAEGLVVTGFVFQVRKGNNLNTTFNVLRKTTGANPVVIGTVSTSTGASLNLSLTLGAAETVVANTAYAVEWFPSGGSNSGECWHGFTVIVNQPA
jgi:hypothetical protein